MASEILHVSSSERIAFDGLDSLCGIPFERLQTGSSGGGELECLTLVWQEDARATPALVTKNSC